MLGAGARAALIIDGATGVNRGAGATPCVPPSSTAERAAGIAGHTSVATATAGTVDTWSGCIALGITGGRRVLGRNAAVPYWAGRRAHRRGPGMNEKLTEPTVLPT